MDNLEKDCNISSKYESYTFHRLVSGRMWVKSMDCSSCITTWYVDYECTKTLSWDLVLIWKENFGSEYGTLWDMMSIDQWISQISQRTLIQQSTTLHHSSLSLTNLSHFLFLTHITHSFCMATIFRFGSFHGTVLLWKLYWLIKGRAYSAH